MPLLGPGPHPGPHGHLRAPGDRGGEGADRRPGGGHDRRQGPRRRAGVLAGRASNCTLLQRVGRRTAAAVGAALLEMLLPLAALVRTITADNGKEFAGHALVAKALGAGFLFATPYHSWERGLNEHANGLVRGYFSKDTDFQQITDAEVKAVQDRLNARPRKGLGYMTPGRGVPEGAASLTEAVPDRPAEGPVRREKGASAARRPRSGSALPSPGGPPPPPGRGLRRPESAATLRFDGTSAASGPDLRCPGAWIRHHRAIFCARAARSLRKWPVLHFGVEVGLSEGNRCQHCRLRQKRDRGS